MSRESFNFPKCYNKQNSFFFLKKATFSFFFSEMISEYLNELNTRMRTMDCENKISQSMCL